MDLIIDTRLIINNLHLLEVRKKLIKTMILVINIEKSNK